MATETTDARPKTLFRRRLPVPPALASFESDAGQALFAKALAAGTMKCYFSLAQQFRTQDEPAYCGISTLVMALNALHIDSRRVWKGPWRWFHEDMLNCCTTLETVRAKGITLTDWICLAECNGAAVSSFLPAGGTLDEFRDLVRTASALPSSQCVLVLSYSRKHLKQTGDGHFSPMGGYCEEEDAILIMDVARFKYPAHWVKVEDAWKAMQLLDSETGKPRGCMLLEPVEQGGTIVFTFRTHPRNWSAFQRFCTEVAHSLRQPQATHANKCACGVACSDSKKARLVHCFLNCMPDVVCESLTTFEDEFSFSELPFRPRDHELAIEQITREVREHPTFALVDKCVSKHGEGRSRLLATALLLAFPYLDRVPTRCGEEAEGEVATVVGSVQDLSGASELLVEEVTALRRQLELMIKGVDKPKPPAKPPRACKCAS